MDDGDSCDSDIKNKYIKDRTYPIDIGQVVSFCAFLGKRRSVIIFLSALLFISTSGADIYKLYSGNNVSIVDGVINTGNNSIRTKCLDYIPLTKMGVIAVMVAFITIVLDSIIVYSIYYGYPVGANAPPKVLYLL